MNLDDILIGKFFPNPLFEGKTYLALSLPEKGEIQFDFLNEKGESKHRKHCYPKTWAIRLSSICRICRKASTMCKLKSESTWCIGAWRLKNRR